MKTTFIVLLLSIISIAAPGQNRAISQIFEKYSGREGFTSVVITRSMFQLFADVETTENDDFLNTVKNLDFIRILSSERDTDGRVFFDEVNGAIPSKDYQELMLIEDAGKKTRFVILEKEGNIRELIMISGGRNDCALIWLSGLIDIKTVARIGRGLHIEGMDSLEPSGRK